MNKENFDSNETIDSKSGWSGILYCAVRNENNSACVGDNICKEKNRFGKPKGYVMSLLLFFVSFPLLFQQVLPGN